MKKIKQFSYWDLEGEKKINHKKIKYALLIMIMCLRLRLERPNERIHKNIKYVCHLYLIWVELEGEKKRNHRKIKVVCLFIMIEVGGRKYDKIKKI